MRKIRSNIFETNSSSSHSFSINTETFEYEGKWLLEAIENGTLILRGGEYSWGYELLAESVEKANYCAVAFEYNWLEYDYKKMFRSYETGDVREVVKNIFEDVLKRELGCTDIKYDFRIDRWTDNDLNNEDDDINWAYIDHQSCDVLYRGLRDAGCITKYKDNFKVNKEKTDKFFVDLIFNKNSTIEVYNDNV